MVCASDARCVKAALQPDVTPSPGNDEPLALIRQEEYLDEPEPGRFVHVRDVRIAEWPVALLSRPRRTARTIPDFLAPDAPLNRLDILRGTAR